MDRPPFTQRPNGFSQDQSISLRSQRTSPSPPHMSSRSRPTLLWKVTWMIIWSSSGGSNHWEWRTMRCQCTRSLSNRSSTMVRGMKSVCHGRNTILYFLTTMTSATSGSSTSSEDWDSLCNSYDQDQVSKGIVEVIFESTSPVVNGRIHYLPHHGVVRQDKSTSKLWIVNDTWARSYKTSLNNCLYTGPKFGQSIFDILLRFHTQHIALTGDINKAFLVVSVKKEDCNSLWFPWVSDPNEEPLMLTVLRFTRVVFGVLSSPFLLNATINLHMEQHQHSDPAFVDKFLSSI